MLTIGAFVALSEGILYLRGYTLGSRINLAAPPDAVISRQSRPMVVAARPHNVLAVGCSFTGAEGTDVTNNHISLLNGMLPLCNVDNAARDGAGPLECWYRLRQGLQLHHYDSAIYLFISDHLLRDMEYVVVNREDPETPERSILYLNEHWELFEREPERGDELYYYPAQRRVWPLDNHLRLVNFAKVFAYDLYGAWRNQGVRTLQSGSPKEWAKNPWFLERFHRILRGMQADCAKVGTKFGAVCLAGAGVPYSTRELTPPGPGERVPILDANYPVPFIPYTLRRDKDTVTYSHPNIDAYCYYAQKIASWLKRERLIPANSPTLPVPPRFSFSDGAAESDTSLPPDRCLVAELLSGDNVSHRLRGYIDELVAFWKGNRDQLMMLVENELGRRRCETIVNSLARQNGSNPIIRRDLRTLRDILEKQQKLPEELNQNLEKCEKELALALDGEEQDLGDYLESCALDLQIYGDVLTESLQGHPASQWELLYNRAVMILARQLVHPKSADKLQERLRELQQILPNLHSDNPLVEYSFERVNDLVAEIQNRLSGTPACQLQKHIAKYGVPSVDNNVNELWLSIKAPDDNSVYWPERTSRFPHKTVLKGQGRPARAGDMVTIHYECGLKDGTICISTRQRGRPLQYPLWAGYVTHGMEAGITGMRVGEVRTFVVDTTLSEAPPEYSCVPEGQDLYYKVEMLDIKSPKQLLLNLNLDSVYGRYWR